jgi:hypothetical protein
MEVDIDLDLKNICDDDLQVFTGFVHFCATKNPSHIKLRKHSDAIWLKKYVSETL